jgi:penicillin-binding protein 1A
MSVVPATGEIKAWVGGIDWQHFQFDHVFQGKRQVGSTFKPFVYATAIMNLGKTPCSEISNEPFTRGNWTVSEGHGSLTMKDAIAKSMNPPAVRTMEEVGVKNVAKLTHDLGITEEIPNNLATALGTTDITIYEMVGAYNTFANFGNYIKPEMVWRIEDANGRLIKEEKPVVKEVMNEMYAYTMLYMMKAVAEYGTAAGELSRRGVSKSIEIACKTGTSQKNSDGWFIGLTPNLATGVWVGWEDRATHFASTGEGQGARMALPIWAIYMKKIWADKSLGVSPDDKFIKPSKWTGNCSDLQGFSGGYGGEGGLQTLEDYKNPKPDPTQNPENSKKEENINEKLNSGEKVDYNR